jgi:hypothetical protein
MLNVEIEKISNRARPRARPNFLQQSRSRSSGVMTKATAKAKKKKSKKGPATGKSRKSPDFHSVRERISNLVGTKAVGLVQSAIGEANKGHFASMKYLFEVSGLYPAPEQEATPEEDSLVRTLLQRLGLPEEPLLERAETKENPLESTAAAADTVK